MAVIVTPLMVTISNCDVDNWVGGAGTLTTEPAPREGAACLGLKVSSGLSPVAKYDQWSAGGNLSGQHIYIWMMSLSTIDTVANGGFRIYAEDTAGNWCEWYVGGSDNYGGGWQCYVVSADNKSAIQNSSGTYDPSIHRYIGIRFKTVAKSNANNVFWDYVRYGSGLQVTTTSSSVATFDDLISADDAAAVGVIRRVAGSVIVQGEILFGDSASAADCEFLDSSEIILFADAPVAADLYKFKIFGNSGTDTIKFQLGTKSGSAGISGCYIKSLGAAKATITATDTDIDEFKLYGCTCYDLGVVSLPSYVSGSREVIDCNFEACAQVDVDSCTVTGCKFIAADDRGILISPESHHVSDCSFIGCKHGIHFDTAGTYAITDCSFSGNTYDIENSSTGLVTINATDSNPSTYENTSGGTTNIVNTVIHTVTGLDTGSQVIWIKRSDESELENKTESSGSAAYSYSYAGDVDVWVQILSLAKENKLIEVTLGSSNATLPASQEADGVYYNP